MRFLPGRHARRSTDDARPSATSSGFLPVARQAVLVFDSREADLPSGVRVADAGPDVLTPPESGLMVSQGHADGHHTVWSFGGGDVAISTYVEEHPLDPPSYSVIGQILTVDDPPSSMLASIGDTVRFSVPVSETGEFRLHRVRNPKLTVTLSLSSGDVRLQPLGTPDG